MHEPVTFPCPKCAARVEYDFTGAWLIGEHRYVPPKQADIFHGRTSTCSSCNSTVTLAVECTVHLIIMKDGIETEDEHAKETQERFGLVKENKR